MAKPTKKTMAQIAKENDIDISEANAQKVADAYIKPTLDALITAEQNAVADTQTARKTLESDYFKQYRDTMYDVQSRGLTGGLANIDTNRLRMQLGEANSDLSNALIRKQAEIETDRGTALSNAQSYKADYLQKLRDKVSALREQDYQQRYQAWVDAQQLALQRAQIAASYYRSPQEIEAANLQNEYSKMQIIAEKYPQIARNYKSYIDRGDAQGAYEYLSRQGLDKYGYSTKALASDLSRDLMAISQYKNYETKINEYKKQVSAARNHNIWGANGILGELLTGTRNIKSTSYYQNLLDQAEAGKAGITLPSWYTP